MLRRKHHGGDIGDGALGSTLKKSSPNPRSPSYLKDKPLAHHVTRTSESTSPASISANKIRSASKLCCSKLLPIFFMLMSLAQVTNKSTQGANIRMEKVLRGSITARGNNIKNLDSITKQKQQKQPRHPHADEHHHDNIDVYPRQPDRLPPLNSASQAMKHQPSSWVDGERKPKKELLELMERQKQGLDKGVPILTRYLGDDVKVWSKEEEEGEWKELVKKKEAQLKRDGMNERKANTTVSRAVDLVDKDHVFEEGLDTIVGKAIAALPGAEVNDDEKDGQLKDEKDEVFGKKDGPNRMKRETNGVAKSFASPIDAIHPKEGMEAVALVEPTIGKHRPSKDAIFAFAEGYGLSIYLCFVESLHETGFDGDIVLGVSALENLKEGVEEYLRSVENIVLYTVEWTCLDGEGKETYETKGAIRHCQMNDFYGLHDVNEPNKHQKKGAKLYRVLKRDLYDYREIMQLKWKRTALDAGKHEQDGSKHGMKITNCSSFDNRRNILEAEMYHVFEALPDENNDPIEQQQQNGGEHNLRTRQKYHLLKNNTSSNLGSSSQGGTISIISKEHPQAVEKFSNFFDNSVKVYASAPSLPETAEVTAEESSMFAVEVEVHVLDDEASSPLPILMIPGTPTLAPETVVGSNSNREEKTDQIDFDRVSKSVCSDSDLGTAVGDNSTGIENAGQVELDGAGNFFPPLVNSLIIYANDNVHKAPESPPEVDDDPEEVGTSICLWGEGVTSEKGISKRNRSYRVKEAFSLKSRIVSRYDVCLEEANQSFGKNQMHKGACNKARKIWAIFLFPVRDSPTNSK
mmetsp:Transcript_22795/g.30171  ORF Transcript_22795/g.30171 Transcript_22795/m.30171 type:complete len:804 (+) Transcript_22795:712-3123(+)